MQHHDGRTITCDTFDTFIKTLQDSRLKVCILAWREEWAPHTAVPGQAHGDVVFGSLRETTLLAYDGHAGNIVRHEIRGEEAERRAIRTRLERAGLTVEERKRNIT